MDSAELVVQVAMHHGHQARHAQNAAEALLVAAEFLPTVVVLDLNLSGTDGYDTARALRDLLGEANAPRIIVVSGTAPDAAKSASCGIDQHLMKPVEINQLRDTLARDDRRG